jgi:hypothetical protein
VNLVVFFGSVAVVIGGAALIFAVERKRCPACSRRAVAMKFTDGYSADGVNVVSYKCKRCRAELRTFNGGGLITREAFDAGAREPLLKATIHRDQREDTP